MSAEATISIEVIYALPKQALRLPLTLPIGATVADALAQVRNHPRMAKIVLDENRLGIWGQLCSVNQVLAEGDRLELYRPLIHDPKTARHLRAKQQQG